MSFSRSRLILFLTFFVPGAVCAQTDERRLEQVRTYYEDARTFESKGDWVEAEKAWRAALSLAADDARAWTNLGVTLNRQNKEVEALAAWKQAIAIDPKLAGPYFNVGLTLVRKGNYTEAILPLRRALAIEPENDGARRAL